MSLSSIVTNGSVNTNTYDTDLGDVVDYPADTLQPLVTIE